MNLPAKDRVSLVKSLRERSGALLHGSWRGDIVGGHVSIEEESLDFEK